MFYIIPMVILIGSFIFYYIYEKSDYTSYSKEAPWYIKIGRFIYKYFDKTSGFRIALSNLCIVMTVIIMVSHITDMNGYEKYKIRQETIQFKVDYLEEVADDFDVRVLDIINEAQEWNEDISVWRRLEKDPWIGIFVLNVYGDRELVDLSPIINRNLTS